jgi:hypothetical protein
VNSPISALGFISLPLRRTKSAPRDTRFARLDLASLYEAIDADDPITGSSKVKVSPCIGSTALTVGLILNCDVQIGRNHFKHVLGVPYSKKNQFLI